MQMVGDPALIQRAVGATHLTMAVPCIIAGLDVASMLYEIEQPVAPSFKAVSVCLGGHRFFSTLDNFLQELWKARFRWEDLLNRVSIHYVESIAFLFDAYCALVKSLLG